MRLTVSPERAPIDVPVTIRLDEVAPGGQVTVRARMEGCTGGIWVADATFVADGAGTIDLSRDAPIAGSYEGVDGMGLFWSMRREPEATVPFDPNAPLRVALTAEIDGAVRATATGERLIFADDLVQTRVREQGLVGALFRPAGEGPLPAVLVLGGSGGGLRGSYWQAAVLARHGFAALALAYFAIESLPEHLTDIPLEYFERAMAWLSAQPEVQDGGIGVVGTSRGGELVLLLGATYPQIKAVVAYVPSHVIWRGIAPDIPGVVAPVPSWTLGGERLYTMRRTRPPMVPPPPGPEPGVPFALTPGFLRGLEERDTEAQATIPVERINGPVLLISGGDDQMWPSALMAERAVERLAAHNHPYPVHHLAYPDAGHVIWLPGLPATVMASAHPIDGTIYAYGGTPHAGAHASADAWPRVVRFLGESLRR